MKIFGSIEKLVSIVFPNGATNKTTVQPTASSGINTLNLPDLGAGTNSDTMASIAATQTLTNKTLSDTTSYIAAAAAPTSKLTFDMSGITAGKTAKLAITANNNSVLSIDMTGVADTKKLVLKAANTAADATFTLPSATATLASTTDVSTHAGLTTTHGVSGTLVGTSDTQTLTNKILTMDGASECVIGSATASKGTLDFLLSGSTQNKKMTLASAHTDNRTLTLPDATDTLIGRGTADTITGVKTFNTAPVISTITNTGTVTLPTATDTLVARATTDILTNKDIDGATASNTSRITVPKASAATLAGLTRKQATVAYDTDKAALVVDDGNAFKTIGGGLTVVYHLAAAAEDGQVASGTPFATTGGNLYQYDLSTYNGYCRLPQGSTVLAASTATIGFKTFGNTTSTKRLCIQGYNGTETITYNGTPYTDVTLLPVNGWCYLTRDATNTTWQVQDQATFVSGTFAGDLTVTGLLTANLGVKPAPTKGIDYSSNAYTSGTTNDSQLLDWFESGHFTMTFHTGMNTSNTAVSVAFIRLGKMVTLFFTSTQVTPNATANYWGTSTGQLPAGLCPASTLDIACVVADNNSTKVGYFEIYNSGAVSFGKWDNSNFSAGQPAGVAATSATYKLA